MNSTEKDAIAREYPVGYALHLLLQQFVTDNPIPRRDFVSWMRAHVEEVIATDPREAAGECHECGGEMAWVELTGGYPKHTYCPACWFSDHETDDGWV